MSKIKSVAAIPLPSHIKPGRPPGARPEVREVPVSALLVDAAYQRELSDRSVSLIHRIVKGWDWRAYKPPVVTPHGDCYLVLDGQHTAIAAATHGGIGALTVMVVDAASQAEQAAAFIGHNRDRVNITNAQIYFAALTAGDQTALTVQMICQRAGATVLKNATPGRPYRAGEIAAVTTLVSMTKRRTAMQARRVVDACVKAGCAPISADDMKAYEYLMCGDGYAGEAHDDDLVSAAIKLGPDLDRKAEELALAKRLPRWKARAIVIFQNARKRRGPIAQN